LNIYLLAQEANRSGGAAVHTAELCRQLAKRGESVTLICHAADPELDKLVKIHRLPRPTFANWPWLWRLALPLRLALDFLAPRRLALEPPDAFIVSDLPLWWSVKRRFPRVPMVYLPHALIAPLEVAGYPFRSVLQKRLAVRGFAWLERRALNRAAFTVRFTQTSCEAMLEYYGSRIQPRFAVLAPPVPIPAERRPPREPGPPRLLSVGRLVESKNISLLIRMLSPQIHLDWQLDIVGDGELRSRLENEARSSGLGDRIRFHGHREEVEPFYRRADLFVLPSKLENAPLVLLEAMSHGLPALCIRADGKEYRNANHEMVEHGKTGFLANDESDFAIILAELMAHPEQLPPIGDAAREAVIRTNSWDGYISQLLTRLGVEIAKHTESA
jgi:glycosyltransferase involved in cell wall biosynthesis